MDKEILVEDKVDDGRKLVAELVRAGFDVTVAFWAQTSEEGLWSFYIGSASVDPEKIGDAYRTLYACLSRIPDPSITFSEVQLISTSDPIAKAAIAARDRRPGRTPIRYRGRRLGNLSVEEVYIYPPAGAEPADVPYLTVDAVTKVTFDKGQLQVEKVKISLPRQGTTPEPLEWVSDVKMSGNQMIVEKVKITQAPEGLRAEYREEVNPRCPE